MIQVDCDKSHGAWAFHISAGEYGELDEYASSDYCYDTEADADRAAVRWLADHWLY